MAKELYEGNQAMAEAAVRAGFEAYFGYPITPQTEILEHLSKRMPELGRTFVQAESEVAAINMVYGAACTGARVMSTSSSPGVSLMMEGISYIAGTEIPVVLVNVMVRWTSHAEPEWSAGCGSFDVPPRSHARAAPSAVRGSRVPPGAR